LPQQGVCQPSARAVVAPSFVGANWESQINEFLLELSPSGQTGVLVNTLVSTTKDVLRSTFPHVEVIGFAHGNPKSSKAFATAVPDVEIVAQIDTDGMIRGLGSHYANFDAKCLQKAVIRACTDHLAYGDFKFRRSAFKSDEPKVTLLAPPSAECIPFDFSVNSTTPHRHDILLRECLKADARVWELILIVHRWARDRGVSHAAKGHLTPYAWSLAALFFAQVRSPDHGEGALLPQFSPLPPHFPHAYKKSKKKLPSSVDTNRTPVAELFKEFVVFYASQFDWEREVLSVAKATRDARASAASALEWRRQVGGLEISDPFDPTTNLANLLSKEGLLRLREELQRANALCGSNCSLSQLLEPWTPAESASTANQTNGAANMEVLAKADMRPKPSARGSLTALPMSISLGPRDSSVRQAATTTKGKMSLTAPPSELALKPRTAKGRGGGSETDSTQSGTSTPMATSDSE
jgi:hypothetical protein